jgi:hypothetical protein
MRSGWHRVLANFQRTLAAGRRRRERDHKGECR